MALEVDLAKENDTKLPLPNKTLNFANRLGRRIVWLVDALEQ